MSSESLRLEGNLMFKSALDVASVLRRPRLEKAKDLYLRSFAAALSSEDRASAQGNIVAVYHRLLQTNCKPSQITAYNDAILLHASLAIKYGSEPNGKPSEWLLAKKLDAVKFAQSHCLPPDADAQDRFPAYIGRLYHSAFAGSSSVLIPEVRLILLHAIFKQHFLQSVRLLERSDHLSAIQQLEDSRRASVEAQSICQRHPPRESQLVKGVPELSEEVQQFADIESDLSVLREDTLLQMAIARSGQMILIGDELLKNSVFGSSSLNMCGVIDAIHCFRQAIYCLLSRGGHRARSMGQQSPGPHLFSDFQAACQWSHALLCLHPASNVPLSQKIGNEGLVHRSKSSSRSVPRTDELTRPSRDGEATRTHPGRVVG
jgi:hypothetical protein